MVHINTWSQLIEEEYSQWGDRTTRCHQIVPERIARRMTRECDEANAISVFSSFAHDSFRHAGLPDSHLVRMPLGVDSNYFKPSSDTTSPRRPFRIVCVGRVELLKGIQYLLQAFRKVQSPGTAIELWLVGHVYPEAHAVLASYGEQGMRLFGAVSRSDLPALYRQCDVMVFPSVLDAFGLVILEAMASGIPVIASSHSAGPDIISDGIDGYIVPPRDADAIAHRLVDFITDREKLREMGRLARQKVEKHWTWQRYGEQVAQQYCGDRSIHDDGVAYNV